MGQLRQIEYRMKRLHRPKSGKTWEVCGVDQLTGKTWKTFMGAFKAITKTLGYEPLTIHQMIRQVTSND